jgi:hypothetical protein
MMRTVPHWLLWTRSRSRLGRAWPEWMESLAAVRGELAELNQATERDFLDVGEKLQRFLEVSGRISEQCSQLVGFLSGEEQTGAQTIYVPFSSVRGPWPGRRKAIARRSIISWAAWQESCSR